MTLKFYKVTKYLLRVAIFLYYTKITKKFM